VGLHDLGSEAGILDGIFRPGFQEDGGIWNAFGLGDPRHHFGFDKAIVCGSSCQDEARRDPVHVLAHTL
jgi:hypothetical protein